MFQRIIFLLLALARPHSSLGETIVELPNGQILGREDVTSENKPYYAFEKIPYAAPPIGDLRFEPPQPVENWEGVLNATKLDVSCYQLATMSRMPNPGTQLEDCLFLNVFTPKLPSDASEALPIMVFIHGGGFTLGSSSNNPPDMFINNDVILVSLNYRLGVFGFISTEDDVIPGNNGLKDQAFALRWIQDNIGFFGGNPEKVTIFGQSAGAGSCAYQLLNLNSEGLFSGAIQESGTFLSPGMFLRDSRPIAFGTGAILDSTFETSDDSEALLELLRSVDAQDLNAAAQTYASSISHEWDNFAEVGSFFAPVIEAENPEAFITEKMYVALKNAKALPVPIIVGFNSEEKIGMVRGEDSVISIATAIDENLEIIVPSDMRIADSADRLEMGRKIREIYTGGEPFVDHLGDAIRYSSDNFLTRSSIKQAEYFSKIAPTYFYVFSFSGELDQNLNSFEGAGNVSHGAELSYLFCSGTDCTDETIDRADLDTRTRLITLWTNFAKYGNPTPEVDDKLQNVTWPAVSIDDGDFYYLNIGADLIVENHPKGDVYSKWIELYDSLGIDDFDSY